MSFQLGMLHNNADFMKDMIVQISKYSGSELIITDENLNVIFQNGKYIEDKEVINVFDLISECLNDNIKIKIDNFRVSENTHLFMKLLLTNNKLFENMPVDIHFCKIKNNRNKLKGYIIIIQDIVQEIRNKIQKETFIDIISHDLKNPMRANIQILELILKNKFGYINKDLQTVLEELLNSFKFMKYMADNLVIKYQNEFDIHELNKKRYSIIKLIKDKCNKIMNVLDRKKQTIELIVNSKIPDVYIDKEEMEKVIKNLIINASNESRENSKIIIKIEADCENVFVSMHDYGYSSNDAILDNLFDEYISCSNKFRKIGFSLELYNCRKVIEAHGGSIKAENISKNSKAITFSIPIFK